MTRDPSSLDNISVGRGGAHVENQLPITSADHEPVPLHELMSQILSIQSLTDPPHWSLVCILPTAGTLQLLNQHLENQPIADFINSTLRGIGQVIFVNNPLSGFLILLALFIHSPWVALMGLLGATAANVAALLLALDRTTIRNGIFCYNGLLVGAALATFSSPDEGLGRWGWVVSIVLFSSLTTVLMNTFGVWWAKTINTPPLTLPFDITTLFCLALIIWLPQSWFELGAASPSTPSHNVDLLRLTAAIPAGFGQVFLTDKLVSGLLILLAVALCTPLGALVSLLGGSLGLLVGLGLGVVPDTLYTGLWGYNALLAAMAIGGVFYAPNIRSILIGAIAAFLAALIGGLLGLIFTPLSLPVLTVPFCMVTTGGFLILRRSLPSLVPVALHVMTSPEEHWQRYRAAKEVITNFRRQLKGALSNQRRFYLFDRASHATRGDLRYLFNCIDTDQNGTLSTQELSAHLHQAGQVSSEAELAYLFTCMDSDGSGAIDFEEFGELMLRHSRLMANYAEFVTYFLPIDTNEMTPSA